MADKTGNTCGIQGEMFLEQKATVQILTVLHCPVCVKEGANLCRGCADSPGHWGAQGQSVALPLVRIQSLLGCACTGPSILELNNGHLMRLFLITQPLYQNSHQVFHVLWEVSSEVFTG